MQKRKNINEIEAFCMKVWVQYPLLHHDEVEAAGYNWQKQNGRIIVQNSTQTEQCGEKPMQSQKPDKQY